MSTEEKKPVETNVIDADAFVPRNTRSIKIDGELHPVNDFLNLSNAQAMRIEQLPTLLEGLQGRRQIELMYDVIVDFVPTVTRAQLDAMPYSKVGWILQSLIGAAKRSGDVPFESPNA
jgi:hypothetical protein